MGYSTKERRCRRHYGFSEERLLFYHVHSDANDEHGDINEAILKKYCVSAPTCKKERSLRRAFVGKIRRRATILFIATLSSPRTKYNQCNL